MQFMHAHLPKKIEGIKFHALAKIGFPGVSLLKMMMGKEEAPLPNFFYSMGNGVRDIGPTSTST